MSFFNNIFIHIWLNNEIIIYLSISVRTILLISNGFVIIVFLFLLLAIIAKYHRKLLRLPNVLLLRMFSVMTVNMVTRADLNPMFAP